MNSFVFSINVVLPLFLTVVAGIFLKKFDILDGKSASALTKAVFMIGIPALLFKDIKGIDFSVSLDYNLIGYTYLCVILSALVLYVISVKCIKVKQTAVAFVQGAIRSNYAILGIPLLNNIPGADIHKAELVLGFVVPLFNIIAVMILASGSNEKSGIRSTLREIARNPLIIAILAGALFSASPLTMPAFGEKTLEYLGDFGIVCGLIALGASFSIEGVKKTGGLSILASVIKTVIIPIAVVIPAIAMGFDKGSVLILLIVFASPTAVASYVMAKAMNADHRLAANTVVFSTALSAFTIFLWIYSFKLLGII